jgi:bidirectional [NiFe] hydrogenase diaphorase subunit
MSPATKPAKVNVLTLKINDRDVSAREDETILDLARDQEIPIPSLCYTEGLSVWGGCRLCLVEVEGSNKLLSACSTHVMEGMVIHTDTEKLRCYRKTILELFFAERNHICSVCVSNGHCDLQDMAQKCGMDHVRVPYRNAPYQIDSSHDLFRVDHNRCILCTRCVRICDVMGRGIDCMVITDLNQPWGDSDTCTSCGKCVQICPTGALVKKGSAVGEMEKERTFLPYLSLMRRGQ